MATIQEVITAAETLRSCRNRLDAVKDEIATLEASYERLKAMRISLLAEVGTAKTALKTAAAALE